MMSLCSSEYSQHSLMIRPHFEGQERKQRSHPIGRSEHEVFTPINGEAARRKAYAEG